jgi:hypothetical protein
VQNNPVLSSVARTEAIGGMGRLEEQVQVTRIADDSQLLNRLDEEPRPTVQSNRSSAPETGIPGLQRTPASLPPPPTTIAESSRYK